MELVICVVNDKQLPEPRTVRCLSAAGRAELRKFLIASAPEQPYEVRQITHTGIKQSIVMAPQ